MQDNKFGVHRGLCAMQAKRYMPFGDGLRQCIGMSLAKMDYLTALAVLTSHFTMELAPEVSALFTLPFLVPFTFP